MRAELALFREISRQLTGAADRPSAEMKVDWDSDQIPLSQLLTFIDAGDGDLLIATATAGRGDFADAEPMFRGMLQSLRTDA